MYKGSCHCGVVRFELSKPPKQLVDCNCSICHRIGALWGHALIDDVKIISAENSTSQYIGATNP